jgi:sporulation protein YlmC with PRC-barrel domain
LAGLPVVDTNVARLAGVVSGALVDVPAARLAVLNVQHGDGWEVQRIPAEYVYRLGPQTVLVSDSASVDLGPAAASEHWYPIPALVGLEVLTDGGDHVGHIGDAELDERTLAVKAYFLRPSSVWRRPTRIQPGDVLSCSAELMLIRSRRS